MDEVDRGIAVLRPTSWKGYTIGDPIAPKTTKIRGGWMTSELMYPFYEKAVKAGITTMCVHKGLLPADYEQLHAGGAWHYATVEDVRKAAKDWPQISFVMYHSALCVFLRGFVGGSRPLRKDREHHWVSDLAAIPQKYGVNNVYAMSERVRRSAIANPRFAAACWAC